MLYYVMRTTPTREDEAVGGSRDSEPLALVKVNAKDTGSMVIMAPRQTRFGWMAPIHRNGMHVYNMNVNDHEDVQQVLFGIGKYRLEPITQAEWESWAEMQLFPVLRLAMAQ